jgi:hypothetical protein
MQTNDSTVCGFAVGVQQAGGARLSMVKQRLAWLAQLALKIFQVLALLLVLALLCQVPT